MLNYISKNINNSRWIAVSFSRIFLPFQSPSPKSHLLSYFLFSKVFFLPVLKSGHLSSHLRHLADYNWLHIFSYAVWILGSHTAAKISSAEICQVEFQKPKQRQLATPETLEYLKHLHQTVIYDIKPWESLCYSGLTAGNVAKFPRATTVILYNPSLLIHKCSRWEPNKILTWKE